MAAAPAVCGLQISQAEPSTYKLIGLPHVSLLFFPAPTVSRMLFDCLFYASKQDPPHGARNGVTSGY